MPGIQWISRGKVARNLALKMPFKTACSHHSIPHPPATPGLPSCFSYSWDRLRQRPTSRFRRPAPRGEIAFARYTTSYAERDAFANSGPIGVFIEASLPHLYKSVTLTAVRTCGENQPYQLRIVQIVGDGTAAGEVIDRYLTLRQQIDLLAALIGRDYSHQLQVSLCRRSENRGRGRIHLRHYA